MNRLGDNGLEFMQLAVPELRIPCVEEEEVSSGSS